MEYYSVVKINKLHTHRKKTPQWASLSMKQMEKLRPYSECAKTWIKKNCLLLLGAEV